MKTIKIIALLLFISSKCFLTMAGEIIKISPANRSLIPKGKSLDAIDGDWIMKNDVVIAVIGQAVPGREANMRVQSVQGAVIDFTSLADNNDYLAAYYPQGYPQADSRRNPAEFAHRINLVKEKGISIVLTATREPNARSPFQSVTEYELRDGETFLRIKTTYKNVGSSEVIFPVSDKLRMDMDILDATPIGQHNLAYIYNKWFNAAYGIYNASGLYIPEKSVIGSEPGTGLLIAYNNSGIGRGDSAKVKAGEKIEVTRYLMYGKDVASLQNLAETFKKNNSSIATLNLCDDKKNPVSGAFVDVLDAKGAFVSFGITNDKGQVKFPLSPAGYTLKVSKIGHDSISRSFQINKGPINLDVSLGSLSSVIFDIKETSQLKNFPVKLEFKGVNGSYDPYLGSSKKAEGADNFYYAINNKGAFEVPVPPGKYLVIISHGPEYETLTKSISVGKGEQVKVNAEINRLFESPEWVIADFHNHSTISGDNDTETRSRLINLAAAGIEFAPATEHNRISSYTDDIKRFGLDKYLASTAGIELTGPTGVNGGPNHQNSIFLTVQDGKQGGGFPGISPDVYTQMKGIYDYDNKKVKFIQHNHPGMGIPMLYYDKNQDGIIDEGFGTRSFTDAIELQTFIGNILDVTSDNPKNKKTPVFYWLQMLNQGDKIFGTTTSDSHNVGENTGSRFLYVYSKKDQPIKIDPEEIMMNAKKGRMVMSNGPFLKSGINGYLPGDEIKSDKGFNMDLEVMSNNDITIDRVQLLVNGKQDKRYNFTLSSHPQLFKEGAIQFKHSFPLLVDEDAIVIAIATGTKKLAEGVKPNSRSQVPLAVANPFFLDVNGDGFVANKDTLGKPLPVSNKAAGQERDN